MAKVSGPGKFARRVEGTAFDKNAAQQPIREMPSQAYGDRAEMTALQGSAPMSATPSTPAAMRPVPLSAPTQRPTEPITAGAPFGGGVGPEMLPIPPAMEDPVAQTILSLASIYPDPDLQRLVDRLRTEGRA
jgi:hypothetical protein